MFCFVLTSLPLMLCVYLQTFEAALFWKKKKKTSFGIEFQTEEEAKENERSPSVALLCAGLLRRGMVYELERVLRVCNGFLCSMSVTYDGAVLLRQW